MVLEKIVFQFVRCRTQHTHIHTYQHHINVQGKETIHLNFKYPSASEQLKVYTITGYIACPLIMTMSFFQHLCRKMYLILEHISLDNSLSYAIITDNTNKHTYNKLQLF